MTAALAPRIVHGDFTGLSANYAKYRPGYSEDLLRAIITMTAKAPLQMDAVDVGAGTGIWTRMLAASEFRSVTAIEPNDDMRAEGKAGNGSYVIAWHKGSAEHTGLETASADLLSMASSFHWANFDQATAEFHRVLKKDGLFVALWNPRYIKSNPLLVQIENKIYEIAPDVKRVSSGSSAFVETLAARFANHPLFIAPVYKEERQTVRMSRDHYIGVWESVNDIRAQMGEKAWNQFMDYVKDATRALSYIDCDYLTRAWIMQKKNG